MALLVNVSKTNWAVQFVLSDAYIFINLFIIFCINYVTQTNNKVPFVFEFVIFCLKIFMELAQIFILTLRIIFMEIKRIVKKVNNVLS